MYREHVTYQERLVRVECVEGVEGGAALVREALDVQGGGGEVAAVVVLQGEGGVGGRGRVGGEGGGEGKREGEGYTAVEVEERQTERGGRRLQDVL
jgi:hypothetical protein